MLADELGYCSACKGECGRRIMACAAIALGGSPSDIHAIENGVYHKVKPQTRVIFTHIQQGNELLLLLSQFSHIYQFNVKLTTTEELYHIMPRPRKDAGKPKQENQAPLDWKGIVNVDMNAEEKLYYKKWLLSVDVAEIMGEVIASGYGLKITYKFDQGTYLASLSCYQKDDPNYAHTMISRAKTALDAVSVAMYKHTYIAGRIWGNVSGDDDDIG